MEPLRYYHRWRQSHHGHRGSIQRRWIRCATTSKVVHNLYRFQASTAYEQPEQALQDCSVSLSHTPYLNIILTVIFSASLPSILSLLSLWLVMFLFFSILYVEVFSMTKWYSAENRNQNYSSMPKALVMLAFMTTGYVSRLFARTRSLIPRNSFYSEGWNQYMHD